MKNKKRKKKNRRKTNRLVVWPLIILIVGFLFGAYMYSNYTEEAKIVKNYYGLLSEKRYEEMYDLVETELSKEEFVDRVKNIYEGIEAEDISIRIVSNVIVSKNEDETNNEEEINSDEVDINYKLFMNSIAGSISFNNSAKVTKRDGKYIIMWNSSMIYPNLKDDEKVRVRMIQSKRGTIYDRNGKALAKDSSIYEVGIVPSKLNGNTDIEKIAEFLNIPSKSIQDKINSVGNENEQFVSLKSISKEEQELKNNLLRIKGIIVDDRPARVYPYKESTSIMIGYVQDNQGVSGLEESLNDTLKGKDGAEIYIDTNGKIKEIIRKKEEIDGNDVKLTIDVEKQKSIYEELKEDKGLVVSINYNTGEVLSLVSTPSYDANKLIMGISEKEWNEIQNNDANPMFNRYLSTYVPGSTIKPIIGAVGVSNNAFTIDEDFGTSGKKWQPDSSWKDFYITTLEQYSEPANLENALIYSDNIYFAKAALKIGKNNIEQGLNNFGFNSKIDFIQNVEDSTYGKLDNDKTIATTGFGQANVMVNPILMASIYSCFANRGNMVKPYILYESDDENKTKLFKENVITEELANKIKEYLIEVVEKGSGKRCKIDGKTIAGKTGTAEIKTSQSDKNGKENGWFDTFDEYGNLYICMIEDVKDREGSKYIVEKMRKIYESSNINK